MFNFTFSKRFCIFYYWVKFVETRGIGRVIWENFERFFDSSTWGMASPFFSTYGFVLFGQSVPMLVRHLLFPFLLLSKWISHSSRKSLKTVFILRIWLGYSIFRVYERVLVKVSGYLDCTCRKSFKRYLIFLISARLLLDSLSIPILLKSKNKPNRRKRISFSIKQCFIVIFCFK